VSNVLFTTLLIAAYQYFVPQNDGLSTHVRTIDDVQLVVKLPYECVANRAIPISIEVLNHRKGDVILRARPDGTSFMVLVRNVHRRRVNGRPNSSMYLEEGGLHGLSEKGLPPIAHGEKFEQAHDLNQLYVLDEPGDYTVSIYSTVNTGGTVVPLEIVNIPLKVVASR